ncbi:hypothetical protein [Catenulispora rubra]|uniref:hypothetical protein n=1 Tax=Catenulispora rubra TaxID=280293 RepID=UPI0018920418|nr:hypothetical protein [Catenulispora rubra]
MPGHHVAADSQDARLAAVAAAAAAAFSEAEYHQVRTADVAALIDLEGGDGRSAKGRRSAVWLYGTVRSRRALVALAALHAWEEFRAGQSDAAVPPEPTTLEEAHAAVADALLTVARFHRAARFLLRQVELGLGDIATSEKRAESGDQAPVSWPGSAWGRVAAEGYAGRFGVYADHLGPRLLAAARAVCPMTAAQAAEQAVTLSDLAFRALCGDPDGPIDLIAEGLAAYWAERDLVRVAGRWTRELAAAEKAVDGAVRWSGDVRAELAAQGFLTRVLLDSGALYERCAREEARRIKMLSAAGAPVPAPEAAAAGSAGETTGSEQARNAAGNTGGIGSIGDTGGSRDTSGIGIVADLQTLCDAASRRGLALQRFGDLAGAEAAHRQARSVAEIGLAPLGADEVASYVARSDHNLAEIALERRSPVAESLDERALAVRQNLARGGSSASWRRLSLTMELQVRVVGLGGGAVAAVRCADALLDDRIASAGGPDNAGVAAARVVLGEALTRCGHPLEARHHLEIARLLHLERLAPFSYAVHRGALHLARACLALDDPAGALRILPDGDALAWFAVRGSARLAARLGVARAVALGRSGRLDEADAELDVVLRLDAVGDGAGAGVLADGWAASDPLFLAAQRCRAEILRRGGQIAAATDLAARVLTAERDIDAGRFSAATAATLRDLARCADADRAVDLARSHYETLHREVGTALDPAHATVSSAQLDQARRLYAAGDLTGAGELVSVLVDRSPLGHGRPVLQEGHPVLGAARDLAAQMGLAAPTADDDWDEG